ncbi:glycosyltransferase [Fictibacillus halophilus]|uniref:glycosyltransferase n=1 Tax=Fictibacillus halophilus TaxID=1610490 RepID=UPI001CFA13EB|nr:glycosyltransferase [Fictibacillus halophilus]
MIFVTVGTHEQSFDRLIKEIDRLKGEQIIKSKVFIQSGYSNYKIENCEYKKMIDYSEMVEKTMEADIVITHGGPGSIMLPLSYYKIPIVVPRQHQYDEHVDDHQVLFTKRLEQENKILAVYEIDRIRELVINYEEKIRDMLTNQDSKGNNLPTFINRLDIITEELLNK